MEIVRTYVDEVSYTEHVREIFEYYSLHDIIQSDAVDSYATFLRGNHKSLNCDELLDVLSEIALLYEVAADK